MAYRIARSATETLGSIVCFLAVIATLVAVDDRVGDRLSAEFSTGALVAWTDRAWTIARIVLDTAREQSLEHAPLVAFSVVAIVLVLVMRRT